MPYKLMPCNALAQTGNPMQSVEVNELIKAIKKAKLWKQGKACSARCPLEQSEFQGALCILEQKTDVHCNYCVPTMMKFQYNLIAHIDDTANFETNDLKPNEEFPFALLCQMCWSKMCWKNVMHQNRFYLVQWILTFAFCWHCQSIWKHGWNMVMAYMVISCSVMPWMMECQHESSTMFVVSLSNEF